MERYKSWLERAKSSFELSKAVVVNNVYFEDRCYQLLKQIMQLKQGILVYMMK